MSTLEKAIALAACAHAGQKDKAGAPYILHPIRVMSSVETETEKIVAILHDVVEDTPVDLPMLEKLGFSKEVLDALGCLTRRTCEPYEDFILRVKENPIAVKVKLADLNDNLDLKRYKDPSMVNMDRLKRYMRAKAILSGNS
ncbi:GTP pyrophosphokinase [Methanocella conradii]|uniref:GTP pyrophosphokinase n=1 Tax=Methanocella conradii TaxID=1175444 RepID=UPI00157C103C|nr:GTP pyrophosphokinase [Methanocella conradii]